MNGTTVVWQWKMVNGRKWRGTFKAFVPVQYAGKVEGNYPDTFIDAVCQYLVRIVRFDSLRRGVMIDASKVQIALQAIEPYGGEVVSA